MGCAESSTMRNSNERHNYLKCAVPETKHRPNNSNDLTPSARYMASDAASITAVAANCHVPYPPQQWLIPSHEVSTDCASSGKPSGTLGFRETEDWHPDFLFPIGKKGTYDAKRDPDHPAYDSSISSRGKMSQLNGGLKPNRYFHPTGVTALPDGNALVCDTGNSRLQILCPYSQVVVRTIERRPGTKKIRGDEAIYRPVAAAVLPCGEEVVIVDTGLNRLQVIDIRTGAFKRNITGQGKGSGPRQLTTPTGVAVLPSLKEAGDASRPRIVVCDSGNNRLQVIDPYSGEFLETLVDDFNHPSDVVVLTKEWVTRQQRVKEVEKAQWSHHGYGSLGQHYTGALISRKQRMQLQHEKNFFYLCVTDSGNHRICLLKYVPNRGKNTVIAASLRQVIGVTQRTCLLSSSASHNRSRPTRNMNFNMATNDQYNELQPSDLHHLNDNAVEQQDFLCGDTALNAYSSEGSDDDVDGENISDETCGNRERLPLSTAARQRYVARHTLIRRVTAGGRGSGRGQMCYPCRIAELPSGHVIVSDIRNHRLQIFDPLAAPDSYVAMKSINQEHKSNWTEGSWYNDMDWRGAPLPFVAVVASNGAGEKPDQLDLPAGLALIPAVRPFTPFSMLSTAIASHGNCVMIAGGESATERGSAIKSDHSSASHSPNRQLVKMPIVAEDEKVVGCQSKAYQGSFCVGLSKLRDCCHSVSKQNTDISSTNLTGRDRLEYDHKSAHTDPARYYAQVQSHTGGVGVLDGYRILVCDYQNSRLQMLDDPIPRHCADWLPLSLARNVLREAMPNPDVVPRNVIDEHVAPYLSLPHNTLGTSGTTSDYKKKKIAENQKVVAAFRDVVYHSLKSCSENRRSQEQQMRTSTSCTSSASTPTSTITPVFGTATTKQWEAPQSTSVLPTEVKIAEHSSVSYSVLPKTGSRSSFRTMPQGASVYNLPFMNMSSPLLQP